MYASLLTLIALAGVSPAAPLPQAQCAVSAERSATVELSGAQLGRIVARAGTLRIEGRPGLGEIRARGTACAASRADLERIRLVTEREGSEVSLIVEVPDVESGSTGARYFAMDLVIEVPESLALQVIDSSGDLEIHHVASLDLQDSSGDADLSDVAGAVRVRDSSGNVFLEGVRGDVLLIDSSGDLTVRNVQGNVEVESDSSGDIRISDVARNAVVRRDSSGNISATGVRGDFTVERDTSGSISYDRVAGRVRVPERD